MSETTPVIELHDVGHNYDGGLQAVRGVSLSIQPAEFIAFVGSNGSGKTTLIKHFNGLLKPTKGMVRVNGKDTRRATVSQLSRTVGFVFQNPDHQIFAFSVWEEILFGLNQQRLPKDEAGDRASRALQTVGLYEKREAHPRELSRGQRQRLATASVLAMETDVLMLDEPTTGQDYTSRRQIMDLAASLHQRGRTIVIITHDMALVAEYATRAVVMKLGQVILDSAPADLFARDDILSATGLKLPPALELAQRLRAAGVVIPNHVITLDELCKAIGQGARVKSIT